MRKISKFGEPFFFVVGIILAMSTSYAFAQESADPLPPPVDIEITLQNISKIGEEMELTIKVTPKEYLHADISLLLPPGIRPAREEGIMARSYIDDGIYPPDMERQLMYIEAVVLWVGPLEQNITKEFSLPIIIPAKERYEFIVRVEALAKWGIKEKNLVIDLN